MTVSLDLNPDSEARFRALVENCSDAIAIIDADGILRYTPPTAQRLLGYAPDEFLGKNPFVLVHPDDASRIAAAFRRLLAEPGGRVTELYRSRHKNGSWVWVEAIGTNLLHEPEVQGIVVNYRDVTERKRHEEEMRYVLASARCLLWHADVWSPGPDLPLEWDLHFTDEEAARRFMPVSVREGQSYSDAWNLSRLAEDRERMDRYGRQEVLAGRSYSQEYRCRLIDGEIRWLAETVHVETVAEGRWRAVGTCTDITELKRREQEIEALNARLRRMMEETHHRVRNDLQVIAALTDIQEMEDSETVPIEEFKRIGAHIRALSAVHDILTQQARDGGNLHDVSARKILSKLIPLVEQAASSRRITTHIDDVRLTARQGSSLAIVASELITNALRYGRGAIEVRFTAAQDRAVLEIAAGGEAFCARFDPLPANDTGLEMMRHVARWDLNADVRFEAQAQTGGRVLVSIPLSSPTMEP